MTTDPANQAARLASPTIQQSWWHKPLIWGGFLVLLYLLHEFFLIGFFDVPAVFRGPQPDWIVDAAHLAHA